MSSSLFVTLAIAPVILLTVWFTTSSIISTTMSPPDALRNKRIILLIAHPDDEAMFFSPTLLSLTNPQLGNHLKILCLSTGDADGLGQTRAQELIASATTLGVRRREDVFVMEDPRFRDGMDTVWRPEDVCRVLGQAFAPQIVSNTMTTPSPPPNNERTPKSTSTDSKERPSAHRRKSSKHTTTTTTTTTQPSQTPKSKSPSPQPDHPRATIDVLITFDSHGISSHPNHIALHQGAHLFLSTVMKGHAGHASPISLYTLPTINLVRKYSFVLDALATLALGIYAQIRSGAAATLGTTTSGAGKATGGKKKVRAADRVMFVSDVFGYWSARKAMVSGHRSQMRWFRWGWVGVGRYMVVNDLRREGPR